MTQLVFMKCRFPTKTQHGLFVMMEGSVYLVAGLYWILPGQQTEATPGYPVRWVTIRTLRFSNISAIDGQEAWVAMHKIGSCSQLLVTEF